MAYRIGIDAGSKTIKVVVLDEDGSVVHSLYRRHRADIKTTLAEVLHDLVWRHGDIEGTVGVTGSAGIGLAEMLGLPFVQEVVATTRAVQDTYPQADTIIELGGEDAKVVYLTGGMEQRMNATCAGGTGGFIDTIAFMLGTNAKNMSSLALGANRIYPIASRCAVFAQTDVRPLLNAGARTSDLAASALEAVVRQTLGGLACGRPIKGTVIFLGGPLEHIPELVRRFRNALGISHKEGIKPPDAHLFTACGAAIIGAEEWNADEQTPQIPASAAAAGTTDVSRETIVASPHDITTSVSRETTSLARLEEQVRAAGNPEDDLVRLPPLFESEAEYATFKERHDRDHMERARLFDCKGPLYLGIDAGSTAVKLAALNETGQLVYSDYHATKGDALKTTAEMLANFYAALPRAANREPYVHVAHATATGYGENLLRAGLGIDSGVVETLAHVRAAQRFRPDLTFLLDIGGQDMKAIWVRNGRVTNAVLNEACSSGCGSFLEGTAYSLRLTPYRFAAEAVAAKSPVDLGTKCTVFMTSRVRHAQKIGVEAGDIAAGLSYSVVKNALFRIIGASQLGTLGSCVVVQGGTFMSDAVLRAFELVSGVEAARPDTAHLMGAIGAALTARMRAQKQNTESTGRLSGGIVPRSTLIGADSLAALSPKRTSMRCPGCENACALTVVEFDNGGRFISGNRCERAYEHVPSQSRTREYAPKRIPVQQQARTLESRQASERSLEPGQASIPSPEPGQLRRCDAQRVGVRQTSERTPEPEQRQARMPAKATASIGNATAQAAHSAQRPPNAVALEQRLLARYGNIVSTNARGQACMGYIDALSGYERKPFWHTLLETLGFSIVVPSDQRVTENEATREGLESIPSESVCFPAKLSHLRLYDVANSGAQAAFMPRFDRGEKCPVTSEYARALEDSAPIVRNGTCPLVSPQLVWPSPTIMRETGEGIEALLTSLNNFAARCNVPLIDKPELLAAFDAGIAAQDSFANAVQRGNERVLAWSKRTGNRVALLGGRPYHMDPAMLHGIDKVLVDVGFGVLAQLRSREVFKQAKKGNAAERAALKSRVSEPPEGDAPWRPGKHFRRLAQLAIDHPRLELVCLQSFGCGYDAVSLMEARDMMEAAGRPFTSLKIDDIADTAHIRIRLRTLAETLEVER